MTSEPARDAERVVCPGTGDLACVTTDVGKLTPLVPCGVCDARLRVERWHPGLQSVPEHNFPQHNDGRESQ